MNASVLVTGAAGFVGVNLVRGLAARGAMVTALVREQPDAATLRYLTPYLPQISFVVGDVRDRVAMRDLVVDGAIERVVHAAAITSAAIEAQDPAGFLDVNLGGTINLLEAARAGRCARFVLVSSSGVYGAPRDVTRVIDEDEPLPAGGLYTIAKVAGEQLCRRYQALYGLSAVAGRLGTAYGPMERPTDSRDGMSQVYTLVRAARAGRPLRIAGADRLRDVVYIDDAAEMFAGLACADQLSFPLYNVSAGSAHSLRTIADTLVSLRPDWHWTAQDLTDGADLMVWPTSERAALDLRRVGQDLQFTPRFSLRLGLAAYLNWLDVTRTELA